MHTYPPLLLLKHLVDFLRLLFEVLEDSGAVCLLLLMLDLCLGLGCPVYAPPSLCLSKSPSWATFQTFPLSSLFNKHKVGSDPKQGTARRRG